MKSRDIIITKTVKLVALNGFEGLTMRRLADEVRIPESTIYYYYKDKKSLVDDIFLTTASQLGRRRAQLEDAPDPVAMLKSRIEFQFDNAEEVVYILKYFFHFRSNFNKLPKGFAPDKAYLHIKEVLEKGVEKGVFWIKNIDEDAKVITHAINGFILEYYPDIPTGNEKDRVISQIHDFIKRALMKGGGKT